jgi:hypothetical protein
MNVLNRMARICLVCLIAVLGLPVLAAAQGTPSQESTATPPPPAAEAVDPTKLGVSLARIKRELVQATSQPETDSPLKLSFTVQVVGQAPKINLLEGFAVSGPLPYGSPTHREVLDVLTPQEFRRPIIPFSSMAVWAAQKLWDRSKKERCEDEIAEYRRAVMAGIAITAPRCTQ